MDLIVEYKSWLTDDIIDLMPVKTNVLKTLSLSNNKFKVESFWNYIGKLSIKLILLNILLLVIFFSIIMFFDSVGIDLGSELYTSVAIILFFFAIGCLLSIPRTIINQPDEFFITSDKIIIKGIGNRVLETFMNDETTTISYEQLTDNKGIDFSLITLTKNDGLNIGFKIIDSSNLDIFKDWIK